MSDAGTVSRRGRNLEGAKNEGSIYGVFFAGSGEPEAGIDFLKIDKNRNSDTVERSVGANLPEKSVFVV